MTDLAALLAFHNVCLCALVCLMTNLVTFEAQLSVTVKAVVLVTSTENAIWPATFIGTFSCHVTELLAVSTFDCRIGVSVVPCHAILHPWEEIVLTHLILLFACLSRKLSNLAIRCMYLLLLRVDVPTKVHVALDSASWNYQVWITLCIDGSDVIFVIISSPQSVSSVIWSGARLQIAFVWGRSWLVTFIVSCPVLSE